MNQISTLTADQKDAIFATANAEVAKEIIRMAELRIQAQLTITIGANQRAATLCGIFATASLASVGAAAAVIQTTAQIGLFLAALTAATFLFSAAVCCVLAIWPADFNVVGNEPRNWLTKDTLRDPLPHTQCYESENYQVKLDANNKLIKKCASLFKAGAILGCASPLAAIGVWLILS